MRGIKEKLLSYKCLHLLLQPPALGEKQGRQEGFRDLAQLWVSELALGLLTSPPYLQLGEFAWLKYLPILSHLSSQLACPEDWLWQSPWRCWWICRLPQPARVRHSWRMGLSQTPNGFTSAPATLQRPSPNELPEPTGPPEDNKHSSNQAPVWPVASESQSQSSFCTIRGHLYPLPPDWSPFHWGMDIWSDPGLGLRGQVFQRTSEAGAGSRASWSLTDGPVGLSTMTHSQVADCFPTSTPVWTHPRAGGPLGATTTCPNSTHVSEAVLDATYQRGLRYVALMGECSWSASPQSLGGPSYPTSASRSKRPMEFPLTLCPTCLRGPVSSQVIPSWRKKVPLKHIILHGYCYLRPAWASPSQALSPST